MNVLFGAEFTQHYAESRGHAVEPKKGAVRVENEERIVRPESERSGSQSGQASDDRKTSQVRANDGATRGGFRMQENRMEGRVENVRMLPRDGDGGRVRQEVQDASIGELFKRLSADGSHLVQQEIQLAKAELQESATRIAKSGAKIGTAVVLALPGIMAITAAVGIGLGDLLASHRGWQRILGVTRLRGARVLPKRRATASGNR